MFGRASQQLFRLFKKKLFFCDSFAMLYDFPQNSAKNRAKQASPKAKHASEKAISVKTPKGLQNNEERKASERDKQRRRK
jgi:hypothetical protein